MLDRLFAGARIGRGGALAVTGEPGVGKTALLDDVSGRVSGVRVLRATGTQAEQDIPFAALHLLLRPVLHLVDAIPEPQAIALGGALALRAGTAGDRFAIGAATLGLLCRYAEDAPVAIVADDLQWMDRASSEALAFTARRIAADPVVVLLAGRSGACGDLLDGLPVLELGGLGPGASGELVRSLNRQPLTDEQVSRLHAATGGNPLALIELGRNPDLLQERAPALPPAVSSRLVEAFSRRLAQLDPSTRTALLVSVVANGDDRLTRAVCARHGVHMSGLAQAERAGLVTRAGGRIDLRHPLVRASIYAGADDGLLRELHRTLAGLLPEQDTERRAWHLAEAASGPDAQVARMLVDAGDRAADRAAHTVASTAYERAARLSTDDDDWHERLCRAAASAWTGGLRERAVHLIEEVEARPASPVTRSRTLRTRAQIEARGGALSETVRILERAAPQVASVDDTVFLLAEALHAAFYLADAAAIARLGAALARSSSGADLSPLARAVALSGAGMAQVITRGGGIEELRAAVPLLAAQADPLTHPEALPWLLLTPLFLRDAASGGELRQLVDAVRSRLGVGLLPNILFHIARDQATSRAWPRAGANYEEAIRLARETGQRDELAMSLAGLAWLESRRGRGEACRQHAAESVRLCAERGIRTGEIWCLLAVGDMDLSQGDARAAADAFLDVRDRLGTWGIADPDLHPGAELVDALLRLGQAGAAGEEARRFAAAADAKGQPWSTARAHRALGLVASDPDVDAPFLEALQAHQETRDVFETARTQLAYGARLRRVGRRVHARVQLRSAVETFDGLGADRWARTAVAELEATGETVTRRASSGAASLTSQELQVSLLLAEGRTTRETATALFLSPKTVEYHLRKVYLKLAIHSRQELAAHLLGS